MRYFDEINILRAFAILAVISIHVSGSFTYMYPGNFLTTLYMAINVFSGFAVPLFVCISGFVLYNKYSDNIDLKKFYKKRLMSILPPYFIFSTIYFAFERMRSDYIPLQTIVYNYLTGGWNYSYWFFILIIQFYLLYPAIIRIYNYINSRGRSFEFLVFALITGIVYNAWIEPDLLITGQTAVPILGVATKFFGYLFYFILGITVRNKYQEIVQKSASRTSCYYLSVPLLCGTIIGIITYAHIYFNLDLSKILPFPGIYGTWVAAGISPLYNVIIFALCLSISLYCISHKTVIFRVLEKIGHDSFGIFLVHLFFLSEIVRVISRYGFGWNNWLFYPITFGLTLIISTLFVEIIQKFPGSKYIIGNTREGQ